MIDKIMQTIKEYALIECQASTSKNDIYRKQSQKEAAENFEKIKILIRQLEQNTKIECYKDAIKIASGGNK